MRVTTATILTVLTLTNSLGQSERINQINDEGLRVGKWVDYDINGKVASIKFYRLGKRKVSAEELFLHNGKVPGQYSKVDSAVNESIPVGQWTTYGPNGTISEITYYDEQGSARMTDRYSYDNSGTFKITRMLNHKTTYVIGRKDSVEFTNLYYHEIKRTSDYFEVTTSVRNLSQNDIMIRVSPHEKLGVQSSKYVLKSADSVDIILRLKLFPGRIHELIELKSDEWSLNLELNGFGYQLTTLDFEAGEKNGLKRIFYYFRTGDEYQMEISRIKSNSKPRHLPLSKKLTEIDLSKGTYLLTIVGPSGRKSKEIEIE